MSAAAVTTLAKERLFANPLNPASYAAGGAGQVPIISPAVLEHETGTVMIGNPGNPVDEAEGKLLGTPAGTLVSAGSGRVVGAAGSGGGGLLDTVEGAAGTAASTAGTFLEGDLLGPAGPALGLASGVGSDVASAGSSLVGSALSAAFGAFFNWIKGDLMEAVLFLVLVIGGVTLAGYGLVKTVSPVKGAA
jgi:hypothetical protein